MTDTTTNVIPMFAFKGQQLRTVTITGEPWFAAPDVCTILGFQFGGRKGSIGRYLGALDADERKLGIRSEAIMPPQWFGRAPTMNLISEPGLYKLIARSSKPEAKAFDRWVRHEVLPAIRQTGGYLLNEGMRETAVADHREEFPLPTSFPDALRKLADETERREAAEKLTKEMAAEIARAPTQPGTSYGFSRRVTSAALAT